MKNVGFVGKPHDGVVAFLSSKDAICATGETQLVAGGLSCHL